MAVGGAVEDEMLVVEGESLSDEEMLAAVREAGAGLPPPVVEQEAVAEVEATRNIMLLMTRPLVNPAKVVEALPSTMHLVSLVAVEGLRKASPAKTKSLHPLRFDRFVTASSSPARLDYVCAHRLLRVRA